MENKTENLVEHVKFVSRDQIELVESFNPRAKENYDIEELYPAVKIHGILVPCLVTKSIKVLEDGRPVYKLFDGYRRIETNDEVYKRENILHDVPVRIFEMMTEDQMLALALVLGHTGKQLKTSEKARAIIKLEKFGRDLEDIMKIMNIKTVSSINQLRKFDTMPTNIQEMIDNEKISFSEALSLMERVPDAKILTKLVSEAEKISKGKITHKTIEKALNQTEDPELKSVEEIVKSELTPAQFNLQEIINNTSIESLLNKTAELEDGEQIKENQDLTETLIDNFENDTLENDIPLVSVSSLGKNNQKPQTQKKTEIKLKKESIQSLYTWLTSKEAVDNLDIDDDKVNFLKKLIEYENGLITIDDISNLFIIGEDILS